MNSRTLGLLACLCLSAPAQAQNSPWCQELWLSRNTVMDRAGQCFSTPLGQAVFDNSDCIEGERTLSPLDAEIIRLLREMEESGDCRVDTSATRIDVAVLPVHRRLMDLWTVPVRGDSEHSCIGYRGSTRDLHAGISTSTTIIGTLEPGQNFYFAHHPFPPDWEYIGVTNADGDFVGHGWVAGIEISDEVCAMIAG